MAAWRGAWSTYNRGHGAKILRKSGVRSPPVASRERVKLPHCDRGAVVSPGVPGAMGPLRVAMGQGGAGLRLSLPDYAEHVILVLDSFTFDALDALQGPGFFWGAAESASRCTASCPGERPRDCDSQHIIAINTIHAQLHRRFLAPPSLCNGPSLPHRSAAPSTSWGRCFSWPHTDMSLFKVPASRRP